jgi:hypothetical protein
MKIQQHIRRQFHTIKQDLHIKWTDVFHLLISCFGDYSREKHSKIHPASSLPASDEITLLHT